THAYSGNHGSGFRTGVITSNPASGLPATIVQRPERGSELGTEEFGFCPCREGPYRSSACPLSFHWALLMPARETKHDVAAPAIPCRRHTGAALVAFWLVPRAQVA